jgi:basic membrane protein A
MSSFRRPLLVAGLLAAACLAVGGSVAPGVPARPRVGLVIGAASLADRSAGHSIYRGMVRAVKGLHVAGEVLTPGAKEGFDPSLAALARGGYDLVIAAVVDDPEAAYRAARRFPGTRFVMPDAPEELLRQHLPNLRGLVFRVEQTGYLVGFLAGLMERRRPGPDVVSAVGGAQGPPVDRFIAGFQAGARRADPGIRVLVGYSGDFVDPRPCQAIALSQIARGSGVVFQVAARCGLGALAAAGRKGVWGIGVDTDQSYLGPHILTSAVKREDLAVVDTVRALQEGTLPRGGTSVFSLANDGVGLGRISDRVPARLVAAVQRIRRRIATGAIRVPTTVS